MLDDGYAWEDRHQVLGRLVLTALSMRLQLSREPAYADIAQLGAFAALLGGRRMKRVSETALPALGLRPTTVATWRFAWRWWYQRLASGALACQVERLTPAWLEQHVAGPGALPAGGSVFVSVHHFNQRLGCARLSMLVPELGLVSTFEPLPATDPQLDRASVWVTARDRLRARSRFAHRLFGPRVYPVRAAGRRGLELLRRNGSLVVLSDVAGSEPIRILGKRMFVSRGALWFAAHSGKPIIPFLVTPAAGAHDRWQLWCGDPIEPTRAALAGALEECIRRSPVAWRGWPEWYAAPVYAELSDAAKR